MLYCQCYDSQEEDMENAIIIMNNMYMNLYVSSSCYYSTHFIFIMTDYSYYFYYYFML